MHIKTLFPLSGLPASPVQIFTGDNGIAKGNAINPSSPSLFVPLPGRPQNGMFSIRIGTVEIEPHTHDF